MANSPTTQQRNQLRQARRDIGDIQRYEKIRTDIQIAQDAVRLSLREKLELQRLRHTMPRMFLICGLYGTVAIFSVIYILCR